MPSREFGTVHLTWISLVACVELSACGVDVGVSSSDMVGGAAPGFGPVALMPTLDIPVTPAASSLMRPLVTAPPLPQLQCLEDAGSVALTRSACPSAPPEPGACDEEALDCLYPAAGECLLAFECALGVWTPLGERCPGPEVSLDAAVIVQQPVDAGGPVPVPSDAAVSNEPDAAWAMSSDAAAMTDAGTATTMDAGVVVANDAGAATSAEPAITMPSAAAQTDAAVLTEAEPAPTGASHACPGLAPVTGSPCGAVVLVCSYAPSPQSSPTRAFACTCGRWYELAPSEVSP